MSLTLLDHNEEAVSRLRQKLKTKPKVLSLLASICATHQNFENAAYDVLTQRTVDNAVGTQLDQLGAVVGQRRDGRDDSDYRRFIRARIKTNRSDGTVNTFYRVMDLLLNDATAVVTVSSESVGSVLVFVETMLLDEALAELVAVSFLRDVAAAGVRPILHYQSSADAEIFRMSGTETGLGFGDSGDPAAGGKFAGAKD